MNKFSTFLFVLLSTINSISAQLIDLAELETDSVTDVDGNVYPTVLIGEIWWMGTNLRTKHFTDGTELEQMTYLMDDANSQNDWSWWIGGERWGYPDFDSTNFGDYGLLYSWDALANTENGGLCPEGWSLADTGDWFRMARIIVGDDQILYDSGTRNIPTGGTESYYEAYKIKKIGRFLKSDNGVLWKSQPSISSDCNGAMMNITPSGEISTAINGFGKQAEFWTPNYVHADSAGQGRRYIYLNYQDHNVSLSQNHRDRTRSVRCVKAAHILKVATASITLDSTATSTDTISVTANFYWTATTNASWLSVAQSVDSADGSVIITSLSSNTAVASRIDTVFIMMDDAKTQTILVTQAGSEPIITVSDTVLDILTAEAVTKTFSIASNVGWMVNVSDKWMSPNVSSGSGNAVITLTAEANTDTITREAIITVESEAADTTMIIKVNQAATVFTVSSMKGYSIPDVSVYPNPVRSQLSIKSSGEVLQVDVFTVTGKKVLTRKNAGVMDVSGLSNGLYLVMITAENGVDVQKIIKR